MICTKCKTDKPKTEFYKNNKKSGRRSECKVCSNRYSKAWYIANPEKEKARHRIWYVTNLEKVKAREKAYYAANLEKIKARRKAYRLKNHKKAKAYEEAYYIKNRKSISVNSKKHYLANIEKFRARDRKYQALKRGNTHEPYTDTYIFERDNWVCGICGQKINKRLKWPNPRSKSIDHIVPISKGGANAPINVQSAHLRCNISKHDRCGGQLRLLG